MKKLAILSITGIALGAAAYVGVHQTSQVKAKEAVDQAVQQIIQQLPETERSNVSAEYEVSYNLLSQTTTLHDVKLQNTLYAPGQKIMLFADRITLRGDCKTGDCLFKSYGMLIKTEYPADVANSSRGYELRELQNMSQKLGKVDFQASLKEQDQFGQIAVGLSNPSTGTLDFRLDMHTGFEGQLANLLFEADTLEREKRFGELFGEGKLKTANVTYTDKGGMTKFYEYLASLEDPITKAEVLADVEENHAQAKRHGAPEFAIKIIDGMGEVFKNESGQLTIELAPEEPMPLTDLYSIIFSPGQLEHHLDVAYIK